MNHLQMVADRDWKEVQEISRLGVQDCLKEIIAGDAAHPQISQLVEHYVILSWFGAMWRFLLAGCNVIHKNKICSVYRSFFWDMAKFHSSHQKNGHKTAFLTRESYQDALISTHFAVILICYMRDNFPDTSCRLDLTVSDPCECVFSLTGQWVGNTHNYSFGEMLDNINNMMRLQIMQANLNGPKFARGHKKQENNWHK